MPQIAKVYIDAAQAAQKAYGLPASVSLAQFALESGYGKYDLGVNNFFGIKYGKNVKCDGFVEKQTKEFIKGKDIGKPSRAFPVTPPYKRIRIRRFGRLNEFLRS
jgi:flagellum-specific peptidoglycan hydrolase FlgJ